MASRPNGAYVSQLLHLDPASAAVVFDAMYRRLPAAGVGGRFVRFGEKLYLSADGLLAEPEMQVQRAVPSVLWFGCRPLRVQIELVDWSSTACEVAIRPLSHAWPIGTDRYARYAASYVEGLVSSLYAGGGSDVVATAVSTRGTSLPICTRGMVRDHKRRGVRSPVDRYPAA